MFEIPPWGCTKQVAGSHNYEQVLTNPFYNCEECKDGDQHVIEKEKGRDFVWVTALSDFYLLPTMQRELGHHRVDVMIRSSDHCCPSCTGEL